MKILLEKLGKNLAVLVLPFVLTELVKAVEEVVKADLNKDGQIGFGGDDDGE